MLWHVKKKRIKYAYPKKVCHMLRHVKKKGKRKEKIAPYPKRKKKRDGAYKGVHTPSLVIKTTFKRRENDAFTRKSSCEIDV